MEDFITSLISNEQVPIFVAAFIGSAIVPFLGSILKKLHAVVLKTPNKIDDEILSVIEKSVKEFRKEKKANAKG